MIRGIVAVLAGVIVAMLFISAFDGISHTSFKYPKEYLEAIDNPEAGKALRANPEKLKVVMSRIPMPALVTMLAGYVIASLAGGYITRKIAPKLLVPVLAVAVLLTIAGIVNLNQIPHPLWFCQISSVIYLPMVLTGARLAMKKPPV